MYEGSVHAAMVGPNVSDGPILTDLISFADQSLHCLISMARHIKCRVYRLHRLTTSSFAGGRFTRAGAASASRGPPSSRFVFVAVFILIRIGSRRRSASLLLKCACQHGEHRRKLLEALHDLLYLANVVDDAVDAAHPVDEALDVAHIVDPEPAEELA